MSYVSIIGVLTRVSGCRARVQGFLYGVLQGVLQGGFEVAGAFFLRGQASGFRAYGFGFPYPKGPCTQKVYMLWPKRSLYIHRCFGAIKYIVCGYMGPWGSNCVQKKYSTVGLCLFVEVV